MTKSKSSGKRYNAGRQEVLDGSIKASRQSNDCACAAQANEISAIRTENATAGIQAFNPASVANNEPLRGDRQDAVGPTVQEQQVFLRIDGKATRIGNAIVMNKGSAQAPVQFKGEERAKSVSIGAGCARDEKGHSPPALANVVPKDAIWLDQRASFSRSFR